MADGLHHDVGGRRVPGDSALRGDVTNPATDEVIARAPFAFESLVADAVRTAVQVPQKRAGIVYRFKALDDQTASHRRHLSPGCPSPRRAGQATIHPTEETVVS